MSGKLKDEIYGHDAVLNRAEAAFAKGGFSGLILFVGPPGVGKKKSAFALAQFLICEGGKPACGVCGPCQRVKAGTSESLLLIEPDGAQIKVDQAREILRFCQLSHPGKARVVIVEKAEALNQQAANALLKLLEEPPANTHFFFIAPHPKSVLPTLRSRAKVLRFGALPADVLAQKTGAPEWVIFASEGRMDRLELLQDEAVLESRNAAAHLLKDTLQGESSVTELMKAHSWNRETALVTLRFWKEFLRDAWMRKAGVGQPVHPDLQSELSEITRLDYSQMESLLGKISTIEKDFRINADVQLAFENFLRQAQQSAKELH